MTRVMLRKAFGFLILMIGSGCALLPGPSEDYGVGYREKGIASWYGEPFHGNPTASGEIFDMYAMTAAHRMLALGTRIKVTNLRNGRTVMVRVNDRGPFIRGRTLDLSYGAARALKMIRSGTAPVDLEVVSKGQGRTGSFTIQVGAFMLEENAHKLSARLTKQYSEVFVDTFKIREKAYFRVRVGSFPNERLAGEVARKLERRERLETFVTRWQ